MVHIIVIETKKAHANRRKNTWAFQNYEAIMQHKPHPMQSARTLVSTLLQQQDQRGIRPAHSTTQHRNKFYAQVQKEAVAQTQDAFSPIVITTQEIVVGYLKDLFLGFGLLLVIALLLVLAYWGTQQVLTLIWGV